MKRILEQFDKLNQSERLLQAGDRVVIALSAGPDSTALLSLLVALQRKYSLVLSAAHLNHGYLSQASTHESLARRQANMAGVSFYCKKIKLRRVAAARKMSLEEAGREERYLFLREIAKKTHAAKIATAHTLDDQAETVLFNLLRGAGLTGLGGIPPRRREGEYTVVRPLLTTRKSELMQFLHRAKIVYAKDPSNRRTEFTRNYIRHRLIPEIEARVNPQASAHLSRLASIARDAAAHNEVLAMRLFQRAVGAGARRGRVRLSLQPLKKTDPWVLSEVMNLAATKARGRRHIFQYTHQETLRRMVGGGTASSDLSGDLKASCRGNQLYLTLSA